MYLRAAVWVRSARLSRPAWILIGPPGAEILIQSALEQFRAFQPSVVPLLRHRRGRSRRRLAAIGLLNCRRTTQSLQPGCAERGL